MNFIEVTVILKLLKGLTCFLFMRILSTNVQESSNVHLIVNEVIKTKFFIVVVN